MEINEEAQKKQSNHPRNKIVLPDFTNSIKIFKKQSIESSIQSIELALTVRLANFSFFKSTKCKTTDWNDKSTGYFSLLWKPIFFWKNLIDSVLDFTFLFTFLLGSIPLNYLGVLIFVGDPKSRYFQSLADKVKTKLATWKGKSLSMMGMI